jgi:hypothetical protein
LNTPAKKRHGIVASFVTPNAWKPIQQLPAAVTQPSIQKKSAKHSDLSCASVGFPLTVNGSNGNGVWVLLADVKSITSFQAGCDTKLSKDESGIINSFMTADGYMYNVNSSTSASSIWRANCKHTDCTVEITFVRRNQRIAKYLRGSHTHLPTSDGRSASTPSSCSGKSSSFSTSMGLLHANGVPLSFPLPNMTTSTAAGCSKSPNDHLSNKLLQYANNLREFNASHHIHRIASTVPLTIE